MKGLLIDDDVLYLRTLQRALARRGIVCETASDAASAWTLAEKMRPDFALVDLKLGDDSGLALIGPLRALRADMRIILVTGYASVATAVDAIKRGADDYLPKPASTAALLRALGHDDASADAEPAPASTTSFDAGMTPLRRLEWEHIQQALQESGGNISAAARLLGMYRRTLQRKLAKRPGPERPLPE